MKFLEKEVDIPPFLWKLHGKRTSIFELTTTYLLGLILAFFCYYSISNETYPYWKVFILFLLSLDIGGGVISNFTKSTESYYAKTESSGSFIGLHILQGALIYVLFPERGEMIIMAVVLILTASFGISKIRNPIFQRVSAILLWVVIMIAFEFFKIEPVALYLLLNLMALKLMVAFAVRWY